MFNFRSYASTNFWNLRALSASSRACDWFIFPEKEKTEKCWTCFCIPKTMVPLQCLDKLHKQKMLATRSTNCQAKSLPLALDKPILVKHHFRLRWAPQKKNCVEFSLCATLYHNYSIITAVQERTICTGTCVFLHAGWTNLVHVFSKCVFRFFQPIQFLQTHQAFYERFDSPNGPDQRSEFT